MRLLLDTHIVLWCLADDPTLPENIRTTVVNSSNTVFVSAASGWEIAIKKAIGKLEAPDDLLEAISACHFEPLSITLAHAMKVGSLPRHHDDPFDRMLIAQSILEGCTLVTRDCRIKAYDVPILPA
ncbi:MAG: type II toxin-antitoxin system VapC family toxin [Hydrococcus sp. Prado102]|jgi:PIN domain nuclease of toxin-antitoxin system|nr:type II toxin-antitoxin system VapC family toxin [Hydrococcus sp. Prado102]